MIEPDIFLGRLLTLACVITCWVVWSDAKRNLERLATNEHTSKLMALQSYFSFPIDNEVDPDVVDFRWQRAVDKQRNLRNFSASLGVFVFVFAILPQLF